jgi:hypothetical protein
VGINLNWPHHLPVNPDDVKFLEYTHIIDTKQNKAISSKEIILDGSRNSSKSMMISRDQNIGQNK